eukprot:1808974-Prorocentrum_lima.AAC.1
MAGRAAGRGCCWARQADCLPTARVGWEQSRSAHRQDHAARPAQAGRVRCSGPWWVGMAG